MKRLIHWSVEHHWIVIALSVLLLAAGAWTARDMPVDVFPDLTAPTVTILAEGHGMAPEEMESLVTFPIESAINGASGVRRVRSATAVGVGVIWVEFDWGTDIYIARQLVAEKLALVAGTLPPQIERPVLAPISSIMGEILFFALSSESVDPLTMRTVADTVVRRRLLAVPGVSQVTPIGGAERQYQTSARVSSRCAGRGPCWCATSPTSARVRPSSEARGRGTGSRRSSSAFRNSPARTRSM
jgi:Cu/Ag efflux pump CusA